jgi:hypothetical protein
LAIEKLFPPTQLELEPDKGILINVPSLPFPELSISVVSDVFVPPAIP